MNKDLTTAPRPFRQQGLTIIEIMVSLAVASILIGLALPAFNNFIAQRNLTAQVNDFMVAIQYARSEAGRRGAAVSVQTMDASDGANEWGPGWCVVVAPPPAVVVCPNDGTELRDFPALGDSTLNGVAAMDAAPTLTFNSRGLLTFPVMVGPGSFDLCHAGETVGRTVSISAIGRVSSRVKLDCP